MAERGSGRVVAVGSSAGKNGGAVPAAAYASSKAGLMCLVPNIAREYGDRGVTVNAVAPSFIETDMIVGAQGTPFDPGRPDRDPRRCGLGHGISASEWSSYITAEILNVSGGFLID